MNTSFLIFCTIYFYIIYLNVVVKLSKYFFIEYFFSSPLPPLFHQDYEFILQDCTYVGSGVNKHVNSSFDKYQNCNRIVTLTAFTGAVILATKI